MKQSILSPGARRLASRVALAALCALLPAAAQGQTATSSLRGYVRGAGGNPLGDVQIGLRNVETNQRRGTATNASGYYYIGGLRPGQYELTARRIGMSAQTRNIQLLIGQTRDLDLTLAEAAVQLAAVEVRAATAGTETKTSEVGTNVTREQIENLPNFERNFLDIAKLAPGMTASAVDNTNKTFAAGGQPADAVNVFIDGATYKNDILKGGVVGQDASKGNPFPQGAVQEFRIVTQNYKAEYQKAASAIITATTKSGSNAWEGDAFFFRIGEGLVQRDPLALRRKDPRPNYNRTQAGANLGGPIVRDKLFVFGTYELNFRDEPKIVRFGPNEGTLTPTLRAQLAPYLGQYTTEFREHLGFGKLTWAKSDRSVVDASLNVRREEDYQGFGAQTTTEAAESIRNDVLTGVGNWRYAGDRWLNEAQVNFQHYKWNPTATNPDLVGREYAGVLRIGGKDTWQNFTQSRISLRDDIGRAGVQWMGDHAFKFGASVDFLGYDVDKAFVSNPIYKFRSDNAYAQPYAVAIGWGNPRMTANNTQFGGYAQDDWSIGRKLVLNLGLRWDGETNMANNSFVTPRALADSLRAFRANLVVGQPVLRADGSCCDNRVVPIMEQLGGLERYISNGRSSRPMYKKAFQPRLGASYDLTGDGRTVVFGGYGIYYDRNYWNTLLDEQFRRQYNLLWHYEFGGSNLAWNNAYYNPQALRSALTAPKSEVFLIANDLTPPQSHQFSGGLRRELAGATLSLSYNGVRGRNYMNFVRVSDWGGPAPAYGVVFAADDRVKTRYNSVQMQLDRPLRSDRRWGGSLAYTLSKSEEQGQSTDMFWGWNDKYPTVADRPWLRAPGDQRHTVVGNAIVRLPADFRFATIVNLGSGIAVNATDASGGWGPYQQQTYVWSPPTRPFLGIGNVFASQNMDLRLEKGVRFALGQEASVVVDLFNAFNSANYGCYETTIIPTADQANDQGWRNRYLQPTCAALGRRLQLGVRYGYRGAGSGLSQSR